MSNQLVGHKKFISEMNERIIDKSFNELRDVNLSNCGLSNYVNDSLTTSDNSDDSNELMYVLNDPIIPDTPKLAFNELNPTIPFEVLTNSTPSSRLSQAILSSVYNKKISPISSSNNSSADSLTFDEEDEINEINQSSSKSNSISESNIIIDKSNGVNNNINVEVLSNPLNDEEISDKIKISTITINQNKSKLIDLTNKNANKFNIKNTTFLLISSIILIIVIYFGYCNQSYFKFENDRNNAYKNSFYVNNIKSDNTIDLTCLKSKYSDPSEDENLSNTITKCLNNKVEF